MFVLKNAWSSIVRRKWRTLLTMFIAIIVTFGTLFGFSVLHADESATDGYNPQLVSAVIRPDAKTKATYNGADSSYTKNYLAFDAYDNYASALQAAGLTYSYALTITVPVRQSGDVKAIAGTDDQSADKTGGEMLYRSFSSLEAAHENELYRYKIVKGKQLDYSSQSKTGVLISQAFAKKNGLDVGDKFTVAFPNDAKKTIEQTVRGIYEYTEPLPRAGFGRQARQGQPRQRHLHRVLHLRDGRPVCSRRQRLADSRPEHLVPARQHVDLSEVREGHQEGKAAREP